MACGLQWQQCLRKPWPYVFCARIFSCATLKSQSGLSDSLPPETDLKVCIFLISLFIILLFILLFFPVSRGRGGVSCILHNPTRWSLEHTFPALHFTVSQPGSQGRLMWSSLNPSACALWLLS